MKLGTALRLAAITGGIVSATILAWKGFHLCFNPYFFSMLELVENSAGILVRPIELVVTDPALKWLRSFGWHLTLMPYWKYVFVLMWLLFSAAARAANANFRPGPYNYWRDHPSFLLFWGTIVAFIASILAGVSGIEGPGVFIWPFAGILLFSLLVDMTHSAALMGLILPGRRLATIGLAALLILFLALTTGLRLPTFARSQGLVALTLVVLCIGIYAVWEGASFPRNGKHGRGSSVFEDVNFLTGLDILAVIGGAATIVAINQMMV